MEIFSFQPEVKGTCISKKSHSGVKFYPGVNFTSPTCNMPLETCQTWDFAPGWNYPCLWETSISSHTFYPRWNFNPGRFHLGLKDRSEVFTPGLTVWFQRVTAINFQPDLILCATLWLIQKILSNYYYFLCLNNWYNVQIASFAIFLKKLYFKRSKKWKKNFFFYMKKWETSKLRQPTSQLISWFIIA